MYIVGQEEVDAVTQEILSMDFFRHHASREGACDRFEASYAEFLGTEFVQLTSSGTNALIAALASLGVGPGDEVIVPAHTYMATAMAVLAVGAIPVVANIDASITLCPESMRSCIGPRTRAVIPVHMWGQVCDMDRILEIAREHQLLVIEDACQCVGGFYKGKAVGTLGDAGAFSFNFFKNISCGEGGAVVSQSRDAYQRARCQIDSCGFFWKGAEADFPQFSSGSNRVSDIQGAMLNAQLDRLPGMIQAMRQNKCEVLKQTADTGLAAAPGHSLEWECATAVMYNLPTPELAQAFASDMGCGICAKTGRHTVNEWTPLLNHVGHINPHLDPFRHPMNADCRMDYDLQQYQDSLDLLARTVMIKMSPTQSDADIADLVNRIKSVAKKIGV